MWIVLVLLPVALAACPCPPAPASSKVCASDFQTYASRCHLACDAAPGVSAVHPGECSPLERAVSPFLYASLLAGSLRSARGSARGSTRTAAEDYEKLQQCYSKNACDTVTCSACRSDVSCHTKCQLNCYCGCDNAPGSSVDKADLVTTCLLHRACASVHASCWDACSTDDCRLSCFFDNLKCSCECNAAPALRPVALGLGVALAALARAFTAARW
ncbi:uncharacterized protein LOC113209059 [Frankliniella occidentalis]|uniref:Uncharacterized protein LOC113209059 n=1 Tax=Frankliniella occidentalis TaxID=133901 RepID=A0A9C6X1H5_FRAOC|nr:uncharacterized protein LOC113209059 [Frankliniella occidentalis]XP_052127429.1 uncharacterized protein LOC113209059 [Frankliniella occidentalis]XP_052127430.1 uncharacterized protein LOC113209059 [Frankliniella occidentalis]XP_052127431.1 uncharacterized protein LOC113209059 [Frankliniella occidentalis]XP_052127432.1 uncharacterized protein LOC113209059 [Frankliniella occidentalis]